MSMIKTTSFQLATYIQGNPDSKKLALVLPGKLDTKDYSHMKSHVDFLAKHGFYAVSFDPPGTWESAGDISLYTMTNYLQAINELIEYFGNKKTFLLGHSRGATMAILASVNPCVAAFASIMSSFSQKGFAHKIHTKWKEMGYQISMRDLPPGGGAKVKEFKLPYSFVEDQSTYKLTNEILQTPKPKLFFLALHDDLIEPQIIRDTYTLFSDPKELHELDCNHKYRTNPKIIEEINITIEQFLLKTEFSTL